MRKLVALAAALALLVLVPSASAALPAPGWAIESFAAPTNFTAPRRRLLPDVGRAASVRIL